MKNNALKSVINWCSGINLNKLVNDICHGQNGKYLCIGGVGIGFGVLSLRFYQENSKNKRFNRLVDENYDITETENGFTATKHDRRQSK